MSLSYSAARYSVRQDLEQAHQRLWASLSAPGTWLTSAERIEVASQARLARHDGTLEKNPSILSQGLLEVAKVVGGNPKSINRIWFDEIVPKKLSVEKYVEAVGVIARSVSGDVFSKGLGLSLPDFPEWQDGSPTMIRPTTAKVDVGWVPMIPNGREGGQEAIKVFGGVNANVIRALSLVPDEVKGLLDLLEHQYIEDKKVTDPSYESDRGLSRAQTELLAGRISALNDCFY